MFIFKKIKVYLLIAALLGAAGFAAWKYYEYTQNQIRIYAENAARAEMAQQETQNALESIEKDLIAVREQYNATVEKFSAASERVNNLEEKLSEHNIQYLGSRRPGLVENIVDKGTKDVLRCFEIESGSPLTEDEINATRKSETNGSCPDIANPNYRP
jgi:chromosome segregation ATPase